MYWTFNNFYNKRPNQNEIRGDVLNTFKAFADAIIPRSPGLAELYGRIQYYGALDLYTDEYIIISLDSLHIPLALPIAEMFNIAAVQFIYMNGNNKLLNYFEKSAWKALLELPPISRLQAISLLLQPTDYNSEFPTPIQNDRGDKLFIIMLLNRLVMMGYYSEWSGYGTTRLNSPNQRKLEYIPISWGQIGYPGPSLGYRVSKVYNFT